MAKDKQNIDEVIKIVNEQEYKFCTLLNSAHQTIVPFNRPGGNKNATKIKIAEIRKRFTALPDGMYYIRCQNSFSNSIQGDMYPIVKGNPSLDESIQQPNNGPSHNIIMPQQRSDKVLSYSEALILIQDNATLKAQVSNQSAEIVRLLGEITKVQTQMSEEPEQPMWQEWVDNTLPSIMPVVDRYMAMEERKLLIKENEQRYKYNGGRQQEKRITQQEELNVPEPGTPEFESFMDWIEGLEDEQYNSVMIYLSQKNPAVYELAYNEFEGEEELPAPEGNGQQPAEPPAP